MDFWGGYLLGVCTGLAIAAVLLTWLAFGLFKMWTYYEVHGHTAPIFRWACRKRSIGAQSRSPRQRRPKSTFASLRARWPRPGARHDHRPSSL